MKRFLKYTIIPFFLVFASCGSNDVDKTLDDMDNQMTQLEDLANDTVMSDADRKVKANEISKAVTRDGLILAKEALKGNVTDEQSARLDALNERADQLQGVQTTEE